MPRRKKYKFPDDYMARNSKPYDTNATIPARPGVVLQLAAHDEQGNVLQEYVPERWNFIFLFLEDIAKREIRTLQDARDVLGDLARAAMLDSKGKYTKAIDNAIKAIRVFISTEDYHKMAEEIAKMEKTLKALKEYIYSEDIALARSENARGDVVLDLAVIDGGKNKKKSKKINGSV